MSEFTRTPSQEAMQLEALEGMCNKLIAAIEQDIAALEKGDFRGIKLGDPEIEKLCAAYGRDVMALKKAGGVKHANDIVKQRMKSAGLRLKKALDRHQLLANAMRHASEGIVQAVAQEVVKKREQVTPYTAGATSSAVRAAQAGAIIYSKVV